MRILLSALVLLFATTAPAQSWLSESQLPTTFAFPVVVALDGNIHIMGGGGPGGATDLHLRYQPQQNKWDTLAPVPFKAQQPAGAVVNGKIHFCGGGYPNTGTRLNLHYVYDPDSAKWFKAANMPVATAIHKAVAFDGKLFCLSGQPDKTLCEYYDPATDKWTAKNALPDQNFWYSAMVANSQTIFRFGGGGYTAPTKAAHKYNANDDTWETLPNLPKALHGAAATLLNDSMIFIAGGYTAGTSQASAYIFNTNQNDYYFSDDFPVGRNYHGLVTAGNCVFSLGGSNNLDPTVDKSMIYHCGISAKGLANTKFETIEKPFVVFAENNQLTLRMTTPAKETTVLQLLDFSGRMVASKVLDKGADSYTIVTENMAAGNYILCYQNMHSVYREKIQLQP